MKNEIAQNIQKRLKIAKTQKLVYIRKSFFGAKGGHKLDKRNFKLTPTRRRPLAAGFQPMRDRPRNQLEIPSQIEHVKTLNRNTLTS